MKVLRRRSTTCSARRSTPPAPPPARARWAPATARERIRTYNFPQGRVTDHRINLTLYNLDQVMEGEPRRGHRPPDRRRPGRAGWRRSRRDGTRARGGPNYRRRCAPWPARWLACRRPACPSPMPRRAGAGCRTRSVHEPRPASSLPRARRHAGGGRDAASRRCWRGVSGASRCLYVTGEREFWGLPFKVSPAVLVPRPDSETVIEAALALLADRDRPWRILDLGLGSGCLSADAAARVSEPRAASGSELSEAALAVAQTNAAALGSRRAGLSSCSGDWRQPGWRDRPRRAVRSAGQQPALHRGRRRSRA